MTAPARLLLLLAPLWLLLLAARLPATLGIERGGPDLLLLAAAAAAWTCEPLAAVLFAAALGCLADAPAEARFGLLAARLAGVAAVTAGLRRTVAAEVPGASALVAAGFVLAERGLALVTLGLSAPELSLRPLAEGVPGLALWNAALAPAAFWLLRRLRGGGPA